MIAASHLLLDPLPVRTAPALLDALSTAFLPNGDPVPATDYARAIYLMLDDAAREIGEEIKASRLAPAELRKLSEHYAAQGLAWLSEKNRDMADALERDVRLAAIPGLYGNASLGRLGAADRTWVNWYARLLNAHVDLLAKVRAADDDFARSLNGVRQAMEAP